MSIHERMLSEQAKKAARRQYAVMEDLPRAKIAPSVVAVPSSPFTFTPVPKPKPESKPSSTVPPPVKKHQKSLAMRGEDCPITMKFHVELIEFGTLPTDLPQKWWNKGYIPNGSLGKFVVFGEQWFTSINYHTRMMCADGVERYTIEYGVRNENWEQAYTMVENERECIVRDKQGHTICARVITNALHLRAKDVIAMRDNMLLKDNNVNEKELEKINARIKSLTPQRFQEGPVLFGLRNKLGQETLALALQTKE